MGKHSSLGPIDPQMILETPLGRKAVPAQAILDQFMRAQAECKDPALLASWLPMLGQYGPALLVECEEAITLSQELVSEWLEGYMFKGREDAKERAGRVAVALANHTDFKSHGRHIDREKAKSLGGVGLVIEDLESSQEFQDAVLSVFHATMLTLDGTSAVKLIENHNGAAFVKLAQLMVVQQGPPPNQHGSERPAFPSPPQAGR